MLLPAFASVAQPHDLQQRQSARPVRDGDGGPRRHAARRSRGGRARRFRIRAMGTVWAEWFNSDAWLPWNTRDGSSVDVTGITGFDRAAWYPSAVAQHGSEAEDATMGIGCVRHRLRSRDG